jgi:hypothetical protein
MKATALVWTSGRFGLVTISDSKLLGEALEAELKAFTTGYSNANPR